MVDDDVASSGHAEMIRFDGRVAVITGAGRGLGRSHAQLLAARGAKVVVNDTGSSAAGAGADRTVAEALCEEIRAAGGVAIASPIDAAVAGGGDELIALALEQFGSIDVVVNNAGILRDVAFDTMSEDDWDSVIRVHLKSAFNVTRAAWPHMLARGYGRIVMTASGAGLWGNSRQANYAAAKMALVGMASTLKNEGRNRGILVNVVAPIAKSRLTETVMPPRLLAKFAPGPVSALVAYLASEHCGETGAIYEAGGGYFSRVRIVRDRGIQLDPSHVTPERLADSLSLSAQDIVPGTSPSDLEEAMLGVLRSVL